MEAESKKIVLMYFYLGKAVEAGLIGQGARTLSEKGFDLAMELIESGEKLTKDEVLYMLKEDVIKAVPDQHEAIAFIIMKIQDDGYSAVVAEVERINNKMLNDNNKIQASVKKEKE